MSTAIIAATGLILGALVTAIFTYLNGRSNRGLEGQRDTVADRDSLIDQLQEEMKEVRLELGTQKGEIREMRSAFEGVKQHNNALIAYIQRLLSIIRHAGLEAELPPDKPDGVHI